jgi:four helix bundle protein
MRDFTKLEMWQIAMEIADEVLDLWESIPPTQAGFKLRDQATDAACSIPSNIAEGSSRRSEKEKFRFFEFSLGSAFELQTRLLIVKRRKWVADSTMDPLLEKIVLVQKKIGAFMGVLGA